MLRPIGMFLTCFEEKLKQFAFRVGVSVGLYFIAMYSNEEISLISVRVLARSRMNVNVQPEAKFCV